MNATLTQVLDALRAGGRDPREKRNGNWMARCPCPNHGRGQGDKHPSLSVSMSDRGRALIHCFAGCQFADVLTALGLDDRRDRGGAQHRQRPRLTRVIAAPSQANPDLEAAATAFQQALRPGSLDYLAADLGLTTSSLDALRVGWDSESSAWAFPMRDSAEHIVGFRLRRPDGGKYTTPGTHEGLFIPAGTAPDERLFIAEGPTDTAALLDLGMNAIGRPSCNSGIQFTVQLVRRLRSHEVVIVADNDEPGRRGAARLADVLVVVARVRVITPPCDDMRTWRVTHHATSADVLDLVNTTAPLRLSVADSSHE